MSIRIFREFLKPMPDGSIDASQIISRECYLAFLESKLTADNQMEAKKFYRVLTTHLSGVDGRRPFNPEEEKAILAVLRQNKPWPCWQSSDIHYGSGFRGKGYHEKQSAMESEETMSHKRFQQQQQQQHEEVSPPQHVEKEEEEENEEEATKEEVTTPLPPLPHVFDLKEPDDDKFILSLATHMSNFTSSFATFGIDVFRYIFGTIRFVLLARTPASSKHGSPEYVKMLLDTLSAADENKFVLIWDLINKDFSQRIVGQNQRAIDLFGEKRDEEHHRKANVVQSQDMFALTTAIASSYIRPGYSFVIHQHLLTKTGDVEVFEVTYMVDPASYLMLGQGTKA